MVQDVEIMCPGITGQGSRPCCPFHQRNPATIHRFFGDVATSAIPLYLFCWILIMLNAGWFVD